MFTLTVISLKSWLPLLCLCICLLEGFPCDGWAHCSFLHTFHLVIMFLVILMGTDVRQCLSLVTVWRKVAASTCVCIFASFYWFRSVHVTVQIRLWTDLQYKSGLQMWRCSLCVRSRALPQYVSDMLHPINTSCSFHRLLPYAWKQNTRLRACTGQAETQTSYTCSPFC